MLPIKSFVFASLPSTNDWAKQNLDCCPMEALTTIRAGEQTAGRGQHGRSWHSPKGDNLYLTLVWFPPSTISQDIEPLIITHLLAYSMIQLFPQLPCRIKWPNDVLCNGKKLAGILCETVPWQDRIAIILGIGINVHMEDVSSIDQPATSIVLETGTWYSVIELHLQLVSQFRQNLCLYLDGQTLPLFDVFCSRDSIKGWASASREKSTPSNLASPVIRNTP